MRAELDTDLSVSEWRITPTWRKRARPADVPEDAPDWWTSDQESSQSFMRAMGVT